jgi:hypothetical protein
MTNEQLIDLKLERGAHESFEQGVCIMEAVAWAAGEPHSDHPVCADPVIAAALRTLNDSLGDDERQVLKPYIFRVIGTKGSGALSLRRSWMALDWIVREYTPAWMELAKLTDDANALRALPEITMRTATAALPTIQSARKRADAARDAAWDAAGAAARDAAGDAARDAARDAAGDAAWAAARDAARAAAWAAARNAAWSPARDAAGDAAKAAARAAAGAAAWAAAGDAAKDAAGDAARAAARAASLRKSFLGLLDRMIDAPESAPIPDGGEEMELL